MSIVHCQLSWSLFESHHSYVVSSEMRLEVYNQYKLTYICISFSGSVELSYPLNVKSAAEFLPDLRTQAVPEGNPDPMLTINILLRLR